MGLTGAIKADGTEMQWPCISTKEGNRLASSTAQEGYTGPLVQTTSCSSNIKFPVKRLRLILDDPFNEGFVCAIGRRISAGIFWSDQ